MKKKIIMAIGLCVVLVLCMVFFVSSCGGPSSTAQEPTENTPTEPELPAFTLIRVKKDISKDTQLTPENMDEYFEAYNTNDEAEANSAVRWDSRDSVLLYKWTKEDIAEGSILDYTMFTNTVPDGVIPPDPAENLTYDGNYVGLINKNGLSMNVAATDLLAKLPDGTTGKTFNVTGIQIKVIDRNQSNNKEYIESLFGTYNLKQNNGMLTFTTANNLESDGLDVLFGNIANAFPALTYSSYVQNGFIDPIVQITCVINVDGAEYTVMLGGAFTMAIDPASGLDAQSLLETAEQLISSSNLPGWLEGLLGGGLFG